MTASGRSLPIMVTVRADQTRCNRWSDRMQTDGQVECNFARAKRSIAARGACKFEPRDAEILLT